MAKKIDRTNILLKNIINAIQDVKGNKIISLDLRKIDSAICKYFVICTGTSNTHVSAIESSIKKSIAEDIGEKPWHVEGNNTGEWILMDYSDIVVHIFQEKIREFYNIEDFWGDAKFINYKAS
jgi:ribosome-associated protein